MDDFGFSRADALVNIAEYYAVAFAVCTVFFLVFLGYWKIRDYLAAKHPKRFERDGRVFSGNGYPNCEGLPGDVFIDINTMSVYRCNDNKIWIDEFYSPPKQRV